MEQDLRRVKLRNRWLLGAIVLVVGGLIVLLVFETTAFRARAQGAGTAKEIRARSIIIEDENGKRRAELDAGGLALWNKKGGASAWLINGNLSLFDENGKGRAELYAAEGLMLEKDKAITMLDAARGLRLLDENYTLRIKLVVVKDGPELALYDEKGHTRFAAGKTATVSPDGKTTEYPESSLILFGPDGKVVWSAIK